MIELENVTKYYGSFKAVDEVSFSVSRGEIVGLLGPNGAGKTTTMRMITGFLEPSAGRITVGGIDVGSDPKAVKRMIGYLPESAPLYTDMVVLDYLRYVAEVQGVTDRSRIDEIASLCGLLDAMHKNIGDLSRGYRQRVGLAHAMLHDPEILILDEPTSGLDPNQIIEVRELIKEIGRTKTVILSTHILPEVEMLCGRVVIVAGGRIAADSPTEELRTRYGHRAVVKLQVGGCSFPELRDSLSSISGVDAVTETEGEPELVSVLVTSAGDRDVRGEAFRAVADRGWTLYEMSLRKNTLEDVFRELTTGGETVTTGGAVHA